MVVTGLGAGIMNGDTQKAIMACVPPDRTGMASGISTTTRFTAIVTSVGVLGAVLAARTHAAFLAGTPMTPDVKAALDAGFMSRVLAGDMAQATAHLPPALQSHAGVGRARELCQWLCRGALSGWRGGGVDCGGDLAAGPAEVKLHGCVGLRRTDSRAVLPSA